MEHYLFYYGYEYNIEIMNLKNTNKYKILAASLFFDAIGNISFLIPGIGEFTDIVWAPVSAWLMTKMYKGKVGKIAAVISLIEEGMPVVDFIPTFTIMWFYTYIICLLYTSDAADE